jgi:hypothetical protein
VRIKIQEVEIEYLDAIKGVSTVKISIPFILHLNMTDCDDRSTGSASASTLTNESQKGELLEIYNSGVKRQFHKSTLDSINKAIRKIALPKIKFLPTTKALGGFDMPDLTSDECWVHKIFDEVNMTRSTLKCKAEVWMTYRNKIKEQFGLHRAGVTMKIKKEFIKGKKK